MSGEGGEASDRHPGVHRLGRGHGDVIVHEGGPLGFTKRISDAGEVTDVVNLLTAFLVVRAESHEAAVKLFEGHPHMSVFVCDGVEVVPLLGG